MTTEDLEAQLNETLEALKGEELRFVRLDGDALSLFFVGGPAEPQRVQIQIAPPWRLVEDGSVVVGSGDARRAGDHKQRQAAIIERCKRLLKKKLVAFELLDFELQLAGDLSIEHFADATGDEDRHFVAIHDTTDSRADFYLGFGWINTEAGEA